MSAPSFPFRRPSPLAAPEEFAVLRHTEPVSRVTTLSGDEAWLLTRHSDIRELLVDARFSVRMPGSMRPPEDTAAGSTLFQDPPRQTRLRKLATKGFTPRRIDRLRTHTRRTADELVGRMRRHQGGPVDLITTFTQPLPVAVLGELLGVPLGDEARIREWTDTLHSFNGSEEQIGAAWDSLGGQVAELVGYKRDNPADDLLSTLIELRELTTVELQGIIASVVIAGNATTQHALNMGMLTLLTHPDEWARLIERPELVPAAVEEILRYQSETDGLVRVSTQYVKLGGVTIDPGETVLAPLMAANHDPEVFPQPDRFDIDRANNHHIAFGHGIHHCVGAALARMQLQEAFSALLTAMPGMRLAGRIEDLPWHTGYLDQGPKLIPVSW
ncbi:cytochrome P450 [Kibdelosporangium aridum]|uniref:Cytochrome P450 n=1 Tax=Kibdelosporangium aridum TaxID=2030 RepID=A0A428Z512_KIBAR|nr:cytochrome P450 [Kibdelosporangium aridum]RSM81915.1 cytochrome P450 [Kibdelosporangium aridum]